MIGNTILRIMASLPNAEGSSLPMVAAVELSTDCDTEATVPSADIIWPTENSLFTALLKLLVGCGTIASGALHLRWVMVGGGGRRSKASHHKSADCRFEERRQEFLAEKLLRRTKE
jgi:hypothetical protein